MKKKYVVSEEVLKMLIDCQNRLAKYEGYKDGKVALKDFKEAK